MTDAEVTLFTHLESLKKTRRRVEETYNGYDFEAWKSLYEMHVNKGWQTEVLKTLGLFLTKVLPPIDGGTIHKLRAFSLYREPLEFLNKNGGVKLVPKLLRVYTEIFHNVFTSFEKKPWLPVVLHKDVTVQHEWLTKCTSREKVLRNLPDKHAFDAIAVWEAEKPLGADLLRAAYLHPILSLKDPLTTKIDSPGMFMLGLGTVMHDFANIGQYSELRERLAVYWNTNFESVRLPVIELCRSVWLKQQWAEEPVIYSSFQMANDILSRENSLTSGTLSAGLFGDTFNNEFCNLVELGQTPLDVFNMLVQKSEIITLDVADAHNL